MTHVQPPKFCDQCVNELQSLVDAGRAVDAGYCHHHGTLAALTVNAGVITKWTLIGPYTEEQALASVNAIRAAKDVKTDLVNLIQAEAVANAAISSAQKH